ncbi:MAG: class B sortase [Lachnospiraceae bacterium]|nr:class B sortase [Lachnospiraceae bacterium]
MAQNRGNRNGGSAAGVFFTTVLLVVAIGVFGFAAFKLVGFYLDYKKGSDEYNNLNNQYVQTTPSSPSTAQGSILSGPEEVEDPNTAPAKKAAAKKETVTENTKQQELPMMFNPVNFADLKAVNEEIVGWIRIGALNVSYPVCQAKDNDYYLHRTFEKQDNFAGCIFLNAGNSPYMTDQNSILYGHNMKNGSMFGSLKKLSDPATYESNPYFWVFAPDFIYQYRIFSTHVVSSSGETYNTRFTQAEFQNFIDHMRADSEIDAHLVKVTTDDRVATLSTCTGDDSTRFVAQGVLEQVYRAVTSSSTK